MTEDELLAQYGICPSEDTIPIIRDRLRSEIADADRDDNEVLKVLCIQLFAFGDVQDSLLIWQAKQSSFDAACYVDIQLLCGAGLGETKEFLMAERSPEAKAALESISKCEAAGDFENFTVEKHVEFYRQYYNL